MGKATGRRTVIYMQDRGPAPLPDPGDGGFTLIGLMVVLLVLAILLALAIPTFLGTTKTADDRSAQSDLNTALTTAKALAAENDQSYSGGGSPVTQAVLTSAEPSLIWVIGATSTPGQVSWYVDAKGAGIVLASPANGGTLCWYAVDNLTTLGDPASPTNGAYGDSASGTG